MHLYPFGEEQERFLAMLSLNPDLMSVMEKDGAMIGTILGGFDGRTAMMYRLAVLPEYQKMGIGSKLIEDFEARAKARGIRKISLHVHMLNQQVIEYYQRKGYLPMDYVKSFYKDL
jgi:ribosomal protein S18 acetylase RimI-like enzyme